MHNVLSQSNRSSEVAPRSNIMSTLGV